MTESVASQPRIGMIGRDQAHALFAQTTGYVAVTAGSFALGAWPGRHLAGLVGIVPFIACGAGTHRRPRTRAEYLTRASNLGTRSLPPARS